MADIPNTQKAWIIERRGPPPKALVLHSDYPVPKTLKEGEVLLKIQAAALNPVGYKLMGLLPNLIAKRPIVAEHDLSGVVVDANGSTEFSVGDQVFGFVSVDLSLKTRQGSLAQYASVPTAYIVPRPTNVSPLEAATFTLAGQTAYQALFDVAKLELGQTVFINGGSSAVGGFAIQFAKAKGLRVVASASGPNKEFVLGLGADEFIDYTKGPLAEHFIANPPSPKFHAIFDAVALVDPSLFAYSPAYLAPNGTFVTTGPFPHSFAEIPNLLKTLVFAKFPSFLGGVNRQWKIVTILNNKTELQDIQKMVADGSVKPIVDSVFAFEDVLKAYERIMSSRAKGKVVVVVDESINY